MGLLRQRKDRKTSLIDIPKPPRDDRRYRVVILPNGIRTLLISEAEYLPAAASSDGAACSTDDMEVVECDKQDLIEGQAAAALCIGTGSFSDPGDIPGFAHFLEHMVFMGSKKYPQENGWDEFLAKNRGETNAWTDAERTCFYFTVQQSEFTKALDIFAQFFIHPLFSKSAVDREIHAVDNECQMLMGNDNERINMIISHELIGKEHPMGKFTAGNKKSLKDDPKRKKLDIYEHLEAFFHHMYAANYMTLVVHSMEPLDDIEKKVVKIFSEIQKCDTPMPKFIKPPFPENKINKIIKVVPITSEHSMEVWWSLPPLKDYYKARVVEFISLLMAHKGKGSIMAYLMRKNLALDINADNVTSGFTHNSMWTAFILTIKLTEVGLQQYSNVLETIFQYILLIKNNLPVHVFKEQKDIEDTKFMFLERESLYDYVDTIAENMHMYPPEHYLCGRHLWFEFNQQLVKDCVDCLTPQGMMVVLKDKSFSNLYWLKEEPWFGSKYRISDVDSCLMSKLSKVSLNPELALPEPNRYISTDFTILKDKSTKHPIVISDTSGCRLWYKKDNFYKTPQVCIFLNIFSSAILKDVANMALADVLLSCLHQFLTEKLYSATLANYNVELEGTSSGLTMYIYGYSHKINLVLEDALTVFKELNITEETFHYVVKDRKDMYINSLMKPIELAKSTKDSLLERTDTSTLNRYEHLCSLTYDMFNKFQREFFSTLFIECFVSGNIKLKAAVKLAKNISAIIKNPLPKAEIEKPTSMELPHGESKCYIPAVNKEDTNSCVVYYFQQGPGTFRKVCLNAVLKAVMHEPLFDYLRTQKQLGYYVDCFPTEDHGILGFCLIVQHQANKFDMKEVENHMTTFLHEFSQTLEEMPNAKIVELVEDEVLNLSFAKAADLLDESSEMWKEILAQTYEFERRKKELHFCETITKADVVEWMRELVSDSRRQLSIMVEGCTKGNCAFASSQNNLHTISKFIKDIKTCMQGRVGGCSRKNGNHASGDAVFGNHNTSQAGAECENKDHITNFCQFKSKLKPLESHIINS